MRAIRPFRVPSGRVRVLLGCFPAIRKEEIRTAFILCFLFVVRPSGFVTTLLESAGGGGRLRAYSLPMWIVA